jgi:ribosomal protein L11 methyltransferase
MFLTSFVVGADEKEELLDALLPLLPSGVHEEGERLSLFSAVPFERSVLEAAVGRELHGWEVEEVPADWRARRARLGGGGVVVGGRVAIRSPWDPPAAAGLVDVVIERRGNAFGSGSHPTTQMCIALMLELAPAGGAADLGCGVGVLGIAAAKLGWRPVVGVDRVPVAIDAARENALRNAVEMECSVLDLVSAPIPLASLLLVNAPPPVHERVAAVVDARVRHVIVSGIVAEEVEAVLAGYHAAGFEAAQALGTEDEWIALRLSC